MTKKVQWRLRDNIATNRTTDLEHAHRRLLSMTSGSGVPRTQFGQFVMTQEVTPRQTPEEAAVAAGTPATQVDQRIKNLIGECLVSVDQWGP